MEIRKTTKGSKAFAILQVLLEANGASVSTEELAAKAQTLCTSTTISQLRKKGWRIKNERRDYKCPITGKRRVSSRYTLLNNLGVNQLQLPFVVQ